MTLADKLWDCYFIVAYLILFVLMALVAVFGLSVIRVISWHDIRSFFILEHMIIVAIFFVFYYIVGMAIAQFHGEAPQ